MSDPILSYLQGRTQAMVDMLGVFVNHDTPTSDFAAITKLQNVIAAESRARGGQVEVISADGQAADHLRVTFAGANPSAKPVLAMIHIDTVWPIDETTRRPFRVEGDKATGPGAYDMKAGGVQTLFALEALQHAGIRPSRPVLVLFTTDEETGSMTSRALVETEARKAEAALCIEPSTPPTGALKTARKGIGMYTLTIGGRAAHAGVEPEKGISALEELAHQILYLQSLNDFAKGTTVTVGAASGGMRRNVVPADARAEIDLRFVTVAEGERVEKLILGLQPKVTGTTMEVTGSVNRPVMERSPGTVKLFELAKKICGELGFAVDESMSGGGSDGNFTAPIVATLDGLGAVGGGAHALTEHVIISEIPRRAAMLAHLIARI